MCIFTQLGSLNAAARTEYSTANKQSYFNDNPLDLFDFEWYPKSWIVFVYMGGASDQPDGEANPFKPRGMADRLIVETRNLNEIAEQQTAASKYLRRTVRASLKQPSTDGLIDLTSATTAAPSATRSITMTHTKDASFDRISLEERLSQQSSMVETLQKLKAKGHPVTEEEIFEAETEMLEMIRSRKKFKQGGELGVTVPNAGNRTILSVDDGDHEVPSATAEYLRAPALTTIEEDVGEGNVGKANIDASDCRLFEGEDMYEEL